MASTILNHWIRPITNPKLLREQLTWAPATVLYKQALADLAAECGCTVADCAQLYYWRGLPVGCVHRADL